jgi:hypothetical protein
VPRRRALTVVVAGLAALFLGVPAASAQYSGAAPGAVFFPPVPVQGPVVLYPTLTLGVEYNDNVFLDNDRRESDFILSATPAFQVVLERPTYRWAAGYSFTAEKFIDQSHLDSAFQRQHFYLSGVHRVNPRLTLTLSEVFVEDKNTNLVGEESVAVGRQKARSNSFSPGLTWQFAPRTSLSASFSYTLQRFDDADASDSNTYRLNADVNHDVTARLTGSLGYEIRHIDVEGQPGTTTHTPRVGVTYRFTPTLTGVLFAGPTVWVTRDDTGVSPYVNAQLTNLFRWGSASAYFTHYVGTAGGLGGTTENTSVGGILQVTTLLRDLVLEAAPRFSQSKSLEGNGIDVRSFTVDLRAAYRFTNWLAGVVGYRFFQQRSDTAGGLARDVDQSRVFAGVQLGWPIKVD